MTPEWLAAIAASMSVVTAVITAAASLRMAKKSRETAIAAQQTADAARQAEIHKFKLATLIKYKSSATSDAKYKAYVDIHIAFHDSPLVHKALQAFGQRFAGWVQSLPPREQTAANFLKMMYCMLEDRTLHGPLVRAMCEDIGIDPGVGYGILLLASLGGVDKDGDI